MERGRTVWGQHFFFLSGTSVSQFQFLGILSELEPAEVFADASLNPAPKRRRRCKDRGAGNDWSGMNCSIEVQFVQPTDLCTGFDHWSI